MLSDSTSGCSVVRRHTVHALKGSPWRWRDLCLGPADAGERIFARKRPRRTCGGQRTRAELVLVRLCTLVHLAQEGSLASPPRDFQSGPTRAGGSPANKAIRPHSFAPVPPRRRRDLFDLLRPSLEALLPARLDEVAVGDALKVQQLNLERRQLEVVCAQQARCLRVHPSAQKPFDIGSWACGLPTRHLRDHDDMMCAM